jgi:hypothetical protein
MARLVISSALALLPLVAWGEGYICAADMAAGFSYNRGTWQGSSFQATDRFVVSRRTQEDDANTKWRDPNVRWKITELGDSTPLMSCEDFSEKGNLYCYGLGEFKMDGKSLRFLYAYLYGYWRGPSREGRDTPYIAIGKCSPR